MNEIDWKESSVFLPNPNKVKTYYPSVTVSQQIKDAAGQLGREHALAMFGYGSSFTGDATNNSLLDLLLIVKDSEAYHKDAIRLRPGDYGRPRAVWFHSPLNKLGFNFYKTSLPIEDTIRRVKYGVIGLTEFEQFARGANKNSMDTNIGKGRLYVAGRLQKAMLVPLQFSQDPEIAQKINSAINQARIDGVWLAMGLMPEKFSLEELALEYVRLSYKADIRIEHPNKTKNIYEKGKKEYEEMLTPILEEFAKKHSIIKTTNGNYKKVFSLSQRDVRAFLFSSKANALCCNYLKNPFVFGFFRSIGYAGAEVIRSMKK